MPLAHRSRVPRPVPVVAGAVAVVLLQLLVVVGPASGSRDPDPVGEWPLRPQPTVVHGFDPPSGPYAAGHRGVDLAGTVGERVHVALPGVVTYAGPIAGVGVVVVSHGATRTTYQPVTASVSLGEPVAGGAVVGTLDLVGSHCFPTACLHWGWLAGDTYLDPLRLVGAGPVRLLPLWRDAPAAPYARWRPPAAAVDGARCQARGWACW